MSARDPDHNASPVLIEVCVGSLDDALAAAAGGADRLELCSALELGGLTPSIGLLEKVINETDLPVMAMIRPRAGGFAYTANEFHTMLLDAERSLTAGAAGIVFGVLNGQAQIDAGRTQALVAVAGQRQSVFHKAFDFVTDQRAALDALIDANVTRVLTSGGASTAVSGAAAIKGLIDCAKQRIEILPGGGISAESVFEIVGRTGCKQVHLGASKGRVDASTTPDDARSLCDLNRLTRGEHRVVDSNIVHEVRGLLSRGSLRPGD